MDGSNEQSARREHFDDSVFKSDELVKAYYHRFETYGKIDSHTHNFHELNFVVKGRGKHFVGEKVFDIETGAVFIIPPNIRHGYAFDDNDYVIFHILFKSLFFDKYTVLLKSISGYNIVFDIEPFLRLHRQNTHFLLHLNAEAYDDLAADFARLAAMENITTKNMQQKKELLALSVIASLCEGIEDVGKRGMDESLFCVMKATAYLQNNYADKITLAGLCTEANMSRSSFLRHFKNCYDLSPFAYLNAYRVDQSKILLRETDKSVVTVAQDCGFFDSSHFIRQFRKKEGVSPQKYRDKKA